MEAIAKDKGLSRERAGGPHRPRPRPGRARQPRLRLRPAPVPLRPRPRPDAAGPRRGGQGEVRPAQARRQGRAGKGRRRRRRLEGDEEAGRGSRSRCRRRGWNRRWSPAAAGRVERIRDAAGPPSADDEPGPPSALGRLRRQGQARVHSSASPRSGSTPTRMTSRCHSKGLAAVGVVHPLHLTESSGRPGARSSATTRSSRRFRSSAGSSSHWNPARPRRRRSRAWRTSSCRR